MKNTSYCVSENISEMSYYDNTQGVATLALGHVLVGLSCLRQVAKPITARPCLNQELQ